MARYDRYIGLAVAIAVGIAVAPYVWWGFGIALLIAILLGVPFLALVFGSIVLADFGAWFDKTPAGRFMADPLRNTWRVIASTRPSPKESRRSSL